MPELESFERDPGGRYSFLYSYSAQDNRVMKVVYLIESDVLLSCLAKISSSNLFEMPHISGIYSEQIALIHYPPWAITI